ncbi:unnamed protein product [Nezara viridula]|uniref:Uncharacterized protein n=1 Tax=Nezara viridula TaxID=85310 RepID=A0A9P0GWC1_NEZVI|nr:unnamed protein product [Nezara viridula]
MLAVFDQWLYNFNYVSDDKSSFLSQGFVVKVKMSAKKKSLFCYSQPSAGYLNKNNTDLVTLSGGIITSGYGNHVGLLRGREICIYSPWPVINRSTQHFLRKKQLLTRTRDCLRLSQLGCALWHAILSTATELTWPCELEANPAGKSNDFQQTVSFRG